MSERWRQLWRLAPLLGVLLLAVAWLLPQPSGLRLASDDEAAVGRLTHALDGLPDDPIVLVGFDPDVGTYPEIRPTVRVLIADLLARDARLAFVSLTTEGRALLAVELDRLARGQANPTRIADLGFIPGAEAALVDLTRGLDPRNTESALARALSADGLAALDAALVVGGNDLGPRSWVEQVLPRTGDLPLIAVAPTVLLPELQPYLASGQVDALLGTPRVGAAYRASAELGNLARLADEPEPRPLPILVGVLLALLLLGQAIGAKPAGTLRGLTGRARP